MKMKQELVSLVRLEIPMQAESEFRLFIKSAGIMPVVSIDGYFNSNKQLITENVVLNLSDVPKIKAFVDSFNNKQKV